MAVYAFRTASKLLARSSRMEACSSVAVHSSASLTRKPTSNTFGFDGSTQLVNVIITVSRSMDPATAGEKSVSGGQLEVVICRGCCVEQGFTIKTL